MLGSDDDAYLAARALQFFAPGIPQVYYVGLLAGENDLENVNRTGEGRELNRHNFTMEEIESACKKPVVKRLTELIRFRNSHPAFEGKLMISETADHLIELTREYGNHRCRLSIDLTTYHTSIGYTDQNGLLAEYTV